MNDLSPVRRAGAQPAPAPGVRKVTICLATMRRPAMVETLAALDALETPPQAEVARIIVADNDETPSARERVLDAAQGMKTPVLYVHAPYRNISIARNACLEACETEWLAFMDDDEVPASDWLVRLFARRDAEGLDVVFGPVMALYPEDAPGWILAKDYHTSRPVWRGGEVQTGHAGNALIRLGAPQIRDERFRLDKGRTGGEDTEYFFRLWRKGVRLGIAEDALLYERVEPHRLSFGWLARRRFRSGQSYGQHAVEGRGRLARGGLLAGAVVKVAYCAARAALQALDPKERNFWALRARFHCGVCAGALGLKEAELY